MMFTARSEMSLVMMLAIELQDFTGPFTSFRGTNVDVLLFTLFGGTGAEVLFSRLSSLVSCLIKKFQVASLKAGWCLSAKSRHVPGMILFAMQADSRLNVPLPDIKSSRQQEVDGRKWNASNIIAEAMVSLSGASFTKRSKPRLYSSSPARSSQMVQRSSKKLT